MTLRQTDERLVDRLVMYTIEVGDRLIVVEHVPARVNLETGERYFAPETVDRLHQIVGEQREPPRVIKTPVFDFAA